METAGGRGEPRASLGWAVLPAGLKCESEERYAIAISLRLKVFCRRHFGRIDHGYFAAKMPKKARIVSCSESGGNWRIRRCMSDTDGDVRATSGHGQDARATLGSRAGAHGLEQFGSMVGRGPLGPPRLFALFSLVLSARPAVTPYLGEFVLSPRTALFYKPARRDNAPYRRPISRGRGS